jgi:hypothetical protein
MARTEREVVARLGTVGLSRALNDILDQARVIRLANAVGLAYPGMRTQSQKRTRLIADLVEKAGRDDAACLAVVRSLRKETAAVSKEWATLAPEQRPARLTDPGTDAVNGRLGAYLFVAASAAPEPLVEDALNGLLLRVDAPEPAGTEVSHPSSKESLSKEAQRLRKKCAELQKKRPTSAICSRGKASSPKPGCSSSGFGKSSTTIVARRASRHLQRKLPRPSPALTSWTVPSNASRRNSGAWPIGSKSWPRLRLGPRPRLPNRWHR